MQLYNKVQSENEKSNRITNKEMILAKVCFINYTYILFAIREIGRKGHEVN